MRKGNRRVILNNDGGSLLPAWMDSPISLSTFLGETIDWLKGTSVDTLFWCVTSGAGGGQTSNLYCYDTKVAEQFGKDKSHLTSSSAWKLATNVNSLIEEGNDPPKVIVEYGHKAGLEIFFSIRMNDVHMPFSSAEMKNYHLNKQNCEEPVEGSRRYYPFYALDSALNYALPEVRNQFFSIIEELCERYSPDGIELDFMRHPRFFNEDEVKENTEIMTDFIRKIRERMNEIAGEKGHKMDLAVRIPPTFAQSLSIGLDVKKWLKERLIDVVIASNMDIQMDLPVEELVEADYKLDCQIFSCFAPAAWWHSRIAKNFLNGNPPALAKDVIPSIEMIRAKCINIWRSGVDGIYLFNFANNRHNMGGDPDNMLPKVINEISDLNLLAHKNKHYIIYQRQETPRARFEPRPLLPVTLSDSPEEKAKVKFMIGDDIQEAINKGLLSQTILKLNIVNLTSRDKVSFKLNGRVIKETKVTSDPWKWYWSQNECWLAFENIVPPLKQGENELEITVEKRNSEVNASLVLTDVEVIINYKDR